MAEVDNVLPLLNDLAKIEQAHRVACQDCSLYRLCLPLGLTNTDLVQLDTIIKRRDSFKRGTALFSNEKLFKSLYVVRSGSFKTTIEATGGREQVTGFYFPGEFLGLDAINHQTYKSKAVALESSTVCELPFDSLQDIARDMPQLQVQLLSRLSKELSDDKSVMLLLGKKTADEKLATFLLSLSKRFQERGFSANQYKLSMSRGDIANHLGLAVETVSRVLTRFHEQKLIGIDGKHIILNDKEALSVLCG